jgi:hypothetical protein
MESPTRDVSDPLSPLRELLPPVCAVCDYSLVGLPPDTRCPECGAQHNSSVVTIMGWGKAGGANNIANLRNSDLMLAILVAVFLSGWWSFEVYEGRGHEVPTVFVATYVGWFGWMLYRRWMLVPPGSVAPARLRVGPAGYEQRLGPGPLRLRPWNCRMRVRMDSRKGGKHALIVRWAIPLRFSANDPIAFEFNADAEVALALQSQIRQWINLAGN